MKVVFIFNSCHDDARKMARDRKDKRKSLKLKKKCCDKPKHKRCKRCPRNG
ncbi:MAG: hypothetical protein AAF928_09135 [Myxococcota bacterium]